MPELETRLADLGRSFPYPDTPDLADAVRARVAAGRPQRTPSRKLVLLLAAAALLAVVGALMAVPQTRGAILRFLHLEGATIERVETLPEVSGRVEPGLGRRVTPAGAQSRVSWTLAMPVALGEPDAVYYRADPPGGMVTFVYGDLGAPDALVSQFLGGVDYVEKRVGPGTRVDPVSVEGAPAFWISGEPHLFSYADRDDAYREERVRVAGNVLLWERGPLLLRLEAEVRKEQALEIARSFAAGGE